MGPPVREIAAQGKATSWDKQKRTYSQFSEDWSGKFGANKKIKAYFSPRYRRRTAWSGAALPREDEKRRPPLRKRKNKRGESWIQARIVPASHGNEKVNAETNDSSRKERDRRPG